MTKRRKPLAQRSAAEGRRLEREAIVAWLRSRLDEILISQQTAYGRDYTRFLSRADEVEHAIDFIETGKHEKR